MISRLSEEKLEKLHSGSLRILEETGVRFLESEALDIFRHANCRIVDGNRVKIDPHQVERALKTAPKELVLYSQSSHPAIHLAGRCAYFGNGSDLLYIIDHRTEKRRRATLRDVQDMASLIDSLPNIDFIMSGFLPSDVATQQVEATQMLIMLERSEKPIVYVTTSFENTKRCIAMAETVAGGSEILRERPFAANYINISHPLKHNPESIKKLIWLSRKGLPFIYRPSIVTRGVTQPITGAGFLAVNNAAALAGLVLSQLVSEGAPFIRSACSGGTFDMATMGGLHSAPEIRGFNEDLAEYYRLPRFGIGGTTGSKRVDQQAAYEGALTLFSSALAGGGLIHDVGYMDNGKLGSLTQLVICHETVEWIKRYMEDLVVDDETLALDVIREVMERDGDFLQTEHTLRHFREDLYPELTDREQYDSWKERGMSTMKDRASRRVDQILSEHDCSHLSPDTKRSLEKIYGRIK